MQAKETSPVKNLIGAEAIEKIKEIAEDARTCMFTTSVNSFPHSSRPMSLQEVDEDGTLWFISGTDTHKNLELEKDDRTTLYFQNNSKYEFLVVNGHSSIHTDRETIDKYWTKLANAWFDGKDDPTVSVIAVHPVDSNYWETKDGKIISFVKMSFSAITGAKSHDGGVEGKLRV